MNYRFSCEITEVFERKLSKHVSGAGADATFATSSAGWYIQLNHMTSIYVGLEKPTFVAGQKIVMKLEAL